MFAGAWLLVVCSLALTWSSDCDSSANLILRDKKANTMKGARIPSELPNRKYFKHKHRSNHFSISGKTSILARNILRTAFIILEIVRSLLSQQPCSKDLPKGLAIARLLALMRDSLDIEHLVPMPPIRVNTFVFDFL
jgi:hypothetical protein